MLNYRGCGGNSESYGFPLSVFNLKVCWKITCNMIRARPFLLKLAHHMNDSFSHFSGDEEASDHLSPPWEQACDFLKTLRTQSSPRVPCELFLHSFSQDGRRETPCRDGPQAPCRMLLSQLTRKRSSSWRSCAARTS
jgi:hypothetical protein